MTLSNNKKNINKKGDDKNKTKEKININNNEEVKNIKTKEEKVPIYLYDLCYFEHGIVYNNYCHDCFKNICNICEEKEHQNHKIEKLNDIMIEEEILVYIKKSLENNINELNNINNYFNKLIEKIKEQYSYFYELKKKEIEIKQKIIKDFEIIKYNYNAIKNLKNINYKNTTINNNSLIPNLEKINNSNDIISELKLIFNYLNESSQTTNLLNNYNNIKKILIENGHGENSDIIQFNKDYLSMSFFNGY